MTYDFVMIVFNGMPWIKFVLSEIYSHANKIIIIEGPVKLYMEFKGIKESDDGTLQFLDTISDPDRKIIVVHGSGFEDKLEQAQEYMKFVTGDYIWTVDADEVYKSQDIPKIKEYVESNNFEVANIPEFRFWGDLEHYAKGGSWNWCPPRIFKHEQGDRWYSHRPPKIERQNGKIVKIASVNAPEELVKQNIYMYHYNYVGDLRIKDKAEYFVKLRPDDPVYSKYLEWFENVFLLWKRSDENVRKYLEKEFGLHPNGTGHTENFVGEHPDSVKKAIARGEFKDLSAF